MNTGSTLKSLRVHLDLPVDRAAQIARSIPGEKPTAVVLRGVHSYCAVASDNSLVAFGQTLEEIIDNLESGEWSVGFIASDMVGPLA